MALALLKKKLPAEDETALQKVDYVDSLVDRTIDSIHRISGDLRPSVLDFGIVAAIEWQAREFERLTGIPCQFECEQEDIPINASQSTALFRIFQEALTNISKHAKASAVRVSLRLEAAHVTLCIVDNGKGMEHADRLKPNSFGIRGMMERVASLHGELGFETGAQSGVKISIRIPLENHNE